MPISCGARIPVVLGLWLVMFGCDDNPVEPPAPPPPPETIVAGPVIYVPDEAATIQMAIDSATHGDTILVAAGVYTGAGNRDLDFFGKSLYLISEDGPAATIIDCQGSDATPHFGLQFIRRENGAVVDGFTITNAYSNLGAAIHCQSSSPTIRNCVLRGNTATVSGGGMRCKSCSPHLINCTLNGNSAMAGGGVFVIAGSSPVLENCIISYAGEGGGVFSSEGTSVPQFSCSNIFGNTGGDWDGRIADQADSGDNISAAPQYCNPAVGDLRLQPSSPCLPANNACGELIGALGGGCR